MARPKNEIRKIHKRKLKKAKEKIKLYERGELKYENLPALARRILQKRQRFKISLEEIKKS